MDMQTAMTRIETCIERISRIQRTAVTKEMTQYHQGIENGLRIAWGVLQGKGDFATDDETSILIDHH